MVGSGSPTRPYLIGQEGGGNPLQNLDVVDDPTLDLTITGDGTVVDKRLISGKATQSMTNLKDVRPGQALVVGDVPIWRTDHWEFEPAGTSLPPGGTDGQVLTKQSSTNGDANWETPSGGGGGGGAVLEPTYAASWRQAAALNTANGVIITVPWDTEDYTSGITKDTGGIFTIPVAGTYQVNAKVAFGTNATGKREIRVLKNGGSAEPGIVLIPAIATSSGTVVQYARAIRFAAGDTVQIQGTHTAGVALDIAASGVAYNSVDIFKVPALSPGGGGVVVERPIATSRQHATAIPAVANNTVATVPWDTAQFDDGSIPCSSGVFTIPVDGWYQVNCRATFPFNATGMRQLRVLRNGASADIGTVQVAAVVLANATTVQFSRALKFAAGDLVQVGLLQTSGGALDVAYGGLAYNSIDITKMPQSFSGSAVSTYGERNYSTSRRQAASVSCTTGTVVQVPWDILDYADGITCDAAGNFTVPVAGYYQVSAKVGWDANGAGYRRLRIGVNNSSAVPGYSMVPPAASANTINMLTRTVKCAAGDQIQVSIDQTSGVTLGTAASTPYNSIDITKVPAPVINGAAASGVWGVAPLETSLYGSNTLIGREIYIDANGQLRARPDVIEMGGSVDLNTMTRTGNWTQSQSADAVSGLNYPVPVAGLLEVVSNAVVGAGAMTWQRYTVYATHATYGGRIYTRGLYGTTWDPWVLTGDSRPPRTIRRKSVTQNLTAASTYYAMPFDVDDEPGDASTITHSNGVFTVPIAGVYEVNVTALFSGASTAAARMRTMMAGQSVRESVGLADNTSLSHSATFRLAAGDTIYTEGYAAATGVTITGSTVKYTVCDITRISA